MFDNSELAVENNATPAIIMAPCLPNRFSTTVDKGESDSASSPKGIMLTTTNAMAR